jgi:carbamoyltransferase
MKNKATLSIYGIKDRNKLDCPAYVHDHNICLMQDGKILQYLQLERYTRRKYDNRLDSFIEELIDKELLNLPDEFDLVSVNSYIGNSFISSGGRFRFESPIHAKLSTDLENGFAYFQKHKWEGKEIKAYNCPQEIAHITSCLPFYGNFKENSLLIHFDGAASVSNFSAFHYFNGKIKSIEYNWELKYLANFFNDNAFVFNIIDAQSEEHCSVPGKLMGYACLGEYDSKIEDWLIKNHYFKEYWNSPNKILYSINNTFGKNIKSYNNREVFFQNVAATFQYIFEREVLNKIKSIQVSLKADYLYYSGGCALNIVTNTKLIKENLFKDVYIPPCCNDSGLSIGAAAFLEWKKGNDIALHSPYLNNIGINSSVFEPTEKCIEQVVEIILAKGIVGVCNGPAEVGPRALGNRSLIAMANDKEIAKRLSMDVKGREWYRPVAPIMLASVAEKVIGKPIHHLSKYMLLDFEVKAEFREQLEGVIHANNTARIQTLLYENENPFMFCLLTYLYEKHNILALINTSFNSQGEPIVHTQEMAIQSAKRMNLNGLIINNEIYKL